MQNLKMKKNYCNLSKQRTKQHISESIQLINLKTKQMANKKTDFCELQHSKHHEALLSEN